MESNFLQDTIKSFNDNAGTPATSETPPTSTPAPAEPKTPQITPPAQTQSTTLPKTPPEPVVPPGKETPPATPPVAQPAAGTPPATPPAPEQIPDEKFYGRLSELTDGTIKTEQEFGKLIDRYNELEETVAKGVQPVFKNERAKLVHSLLSENEGLEPQAAMRILRAISFKPEGKSEKDILFAAYLMDPKNSDLSELDAQKYFDAEYTKKYENKENDLALQREHVLAVKNATADIAKIQSDFTAVEAPAQQANKETMDRISKAVDGFGGVRLSFTDNPQETDFLNIALEDPQELEAIKAKILDPNSAYNEFVSQFDYKTEQGFQDLVRETWERDHHVEIRQKAYEKGVKVGELKMINQAANASDPKRIDQVGTPAAPGTKTMFDAWADAQNKKSA